MIKECISHNSIILEDGEIISDVDNMLYATGYKYSYPFLEKNSHIDNLIEFYNERKGSFGPLYKRLFSLREPNLIFIGVV